MTALPVRTLLPDTNYYLTYEGSLTQPACHETVTWVLFNKPIYVSRVQVRLQVQCRFDVCGLAVYIHVGLYMLLFVCLYA